MNNKKFKISFICLFSLLFFNSFVVCDQSFYKVLKIVDSDALYIDFNNNGICDKEEKALVNGINGF